MRCLLGCDRLLVAGYQRIHVLLRIRGHGCEFHGVQVGDGRLLQVEFEVLAQEAHVIGMVGERCVKILPRVVDPGACSVVEHVPVNKAVVADVFHVVIEGIVLRYVVCAVERQRDRVLIGRRRLRLRVRRHQGDQFQKSRLKGAEARALRVGDQCAGRNAPRAAIGAIGEDDAENLVMIASQFGVELKDKVSVFGLGDFKGGGTFGGEIVRPEHRAIGTVAKVQLCCVLRLQKRS